MVAARMVDGVALSSCKVMNNASRLNGTENGGRPKQIPWCCMFYIYITYDFVRCVTHMSTEIFLEYSKTVWIATGIALKSFITGRSSMRPAWRTASERNIIPLPRTEGDMLRVIEGRGTHHPCCLLEYELLSS